VAASRNDAGEDLLRARVPWASFPVHGPQTIRVSWADPMARFTLAFEAHAIDVLENAWNTPRHAGC